MALIDPCPETWTAVAEHRARKELRKVPHPYVDPRITPKNKVEKFDRN